MQRRDTKQQVRSQVSVSAKEPKPGTQTHARADALRATPSPAAKGGRNQRSITGERQTECDVRARWNPAGPKEEGGADEAGNRDAE